MMIYKTTDQLPLIVRQKLPRDAQKVFIEASKPAKDEGEALALGWKEIEKRWRRPDKGVKWVKKPMKKDNPTTDSVHVPTTNRTLYARRRVKNPDDIIKWAKSQGFEKVVDGKEMHVTIAFSKQEVDWSQFSKQDNDLSYSNGWRLIKKLGEGGSAVVLAFEAPELKNRWKEFIDKGASWDWPDYQSHVTLTYDGKDIDIDQMEVYKGPIHFGPEEFDEVNEDWKSTVTEKAVIIKTDEEQRMVYGWASVISEKGEPIVDTQDHIIEPDELVKATTEFMANARMAKAMHQGEGIGEVLHSFPLTKEIADSLDINIDKEGWIVGVKVHDDEIWDKVKNGTFKAFSIGGKAQREPVT